MLLNHVSTWLGLSRWRPRRAREHQSGYSFMCHSRGKLQTANPDELKCEYMLQCNESRKLEGRLHEVLNDAWIRGEFYSLDKHEVRHIVTLLDSESRKYSRQSGVHEEKKKKQRTIDLQLTESMIRTIQSAKDFDITLELLAEWMQYRVDNLKRCLAHYREGADYKLDLQAANRADGGGRPKESVHLSVDCVKRLILRSRCKRAEQFRTMILNVPKGSD